MKRILAALVILAVLAAPALAEERKVKAITYLASATVTAGTTNSTGFDVSAYNEGQILISVTAESGTSTLDVTVQVSDADATYYDHTACSQITATGQYRCAVTNFGKYVRLKQVVGGTSFTYAMVGVFKN